MIFIFMKMKTIIKIDKNSIAIKGYCKKSELKKQFENLKEVLI